MVDRPTKQVWIDKFEPLKVVGFLFQSEVLVIAIVLVVIWSFLLGAFHVGGAIMLFRSPLALYSTLGIFFCYLFVILDYTARGYQVPPRLSGSLLNSNKLQFFKGLLLTSFFASISYTVRHQEIIWLLVTATCIVCWSVSVAIIAIQDKFLNAINPITWFGFFQTITFDRIFAQYLIVLAAATGSIIMLPNHYGWFNILSVSAFVFSFLLLFRLIGVLIHSNATHLGIPVRYGAEVEAAQMAKAKSNERSDFALQLFQRIEADKTKEALRLYEQYLADTNFEEEAALWQVVTGWAKPDLAIRAGQGYIDRLVKSQQLQKAWEVLEYCFEKNQNQYQLISGENTLLLAHEAGTRLQRQISAELLRYFDKDFPGHPKTADALLLAVQYLLLDAPEPDTARKLLNHIRIKFPAIAKTRQFEKLKQAVD